jgi:hypothetical protein
MDFSQGGSFAGLSIRRRHEGVTNNYDLIENVNTQGCDANDTACAFANGGSINGGPWPNFDNHGAVITNLQTNSFTEFGLDITALLGTTPCFASVRVKTRSSGVVHLNVEGLLGVLVPAMHGYRGYRDPQRA